MKSFFFYLVFIFCASVVSAQPQFKGISDWKVNKLSIKEVDVDNTIKFYNPFFFGIKLKKLYFNVNLNGSKVGAVEQVPKSVRLRRKNTSNIPLHISFKPKAENLAGLGNMLKDVLTQKASVGYEGYAKFCVLLIPFKVRFKDEFSFRK